MPGKSPDQVYAELYDVTVLDWPGEVDFYTGLVSDLDPDSSLLEIACGTGRITTRLAQERSDLTVVGLDHSQNMLSFARPKSDRIEWVQADMRSFDLGRKFDLIIIPGHSFQNLNTPEGQAACFQRVKDHLTPDGRFVLHLDHQNLGWLGSLPPTVTPEDFEAGSEVAHPETGSVFRTSYAWSFESSTQTASVTTRWEELDSEGDVVSTWTRGPLPLHSIFRFEVEHLLARVGLRVEALYGDFFKNDLTNDSEEMIWVAINS